MSCSRKINALANTAKWTGNAHIDAPSLWRNLAHFKAQIGPGDFHVRRDKFPSSSISRFKEVTGLGDRTQKSDIIYTRQAEVSGAHRGLFPTRPSRPRVFSAASNFALDTKTFVSIANIVRYYVSCVYTTENVLRSQYSVCAKLDFLVARKLNFLRRDISRERECPRKMRM